LPAQRSRHPYHRPDRDNGQKHSYFTHEHSGSFSKSYATSAVVITGVPTVSNAHSPRRGSRARTARFRRSCSPPAATNARIPCNSRPSVALVVSIEIAGRGGHVSQLSLNGSQAGISPPWGWRATPCDETLAYGKNETGGRKHQESLTVARSSGALLGRRMIRTLIR
jgi:hypothetical protein